MKRLLSALTLALALVVTHVMPAAAAVSRTAQQIAASNGSTGITITTSNNDVIVVFAYRTASVTAPTLAAGYTSLATTSNATTTNSMRLSAKVSTGSDTTCGTWTNATTVSCIVFRGTNTAPAGWKVATANGSSTTISYPVLALNVPDNNSWVAGFAGATASTNVNQAPTGMTLEASTTTSAASDTEGGVRSWAATNVTINATAGWSSATLEVIAAAPSAATPAEVQWASASSTQSLTAGTSVYRLKFPEIVQAGNCILLAWEYDNAGGAPTFADDGSNTYRSVLDNVDANTQRHGIAVALNVAANTREVRVSSTSGGTGFKELQAVEVTNCYAVDVSSTNNNSTGATSITAGSMTPTVTGDYVWQTALQVVDGHSYTVGSQANITWQFVNSNDLHANGQISQGGVYNSVAALNPTFTQTVTGKFTSDAIAMLGGSRGSTAAAGMRVRAVMHNSFWAVANAGPGYAASQTLKFPTRSDTTLMVASINGGDPGCVSACNSITGITDTNSNSWVECGTTGAAPPHYSRLFYAANPVVGTSLVLTLTSSVNTIDSTIIMYDIVGASTSSPCDTSSVGTQSNTQATGVGTLTGPSITPSTSSGICIGNIQFVNDTVNAMSGPTGATLDSARDDLESLDGPENLDQNGGYGHWKNTSTSSQTVSWGFVSAADPQQQWLSHVGCFKAPAAASTCTPTMSFLGVSSCGNHDTTQPQVR